MTAAPRRLALAAAAAAGAAVVVGTALRRTGLWSDGRLLPVLDEDGRPVPGSLAEKVFLDVNGLRQGMVLRSRDTANPVLLVLHGGMPEYVLTEQYPTGLEDLFTVAWWEQRGAGLSYRPLPHDAVTAEELVADALVVTDYLRDRFGVAKVYLLAHSGGTFFGPRVVARAPERFHAYVGVAQMVDQRRSEALAWQEMVRRYEELGDVRMVRRLRRAPATVEDGTPPAYLRVRDAAMHRLGAGTTRDMRSVLTGVFWPSLRSPQYTLAEKVRTWRAKAAAGVSVLWDEVVTTDLAATATQLDVPVYLFHGSHDLTCDLGLARDLFDAVRAPTKGFYTFHGSAHSPFLEEPERTCRILRDDVLRGRTDLADAR
jgi:pimeloyl-ACP methyl ester carboxylesterase